MRSCSPKKILEKRSDFVKSHNVLEPLKQGIRDWDFSPNLRLELHFILVGCLEKQWNREGVRLQYLAAATTLETCLEHPFTQPFANKLLHSNQQNAVVLRPLQAIASHELLHELLRQQTTIAATPLAESTPSPNSQIRWRMLWTVSNATLARRHLSVCIFCSILFSMGAHLRKENCAFTKAASIPARRQRKCWPRAFWIYFSTLPPISNIFSNFSSSALKRHLLKRHVTLSKHCWLPICSASDSSGSVTALHWQTWSILQTV